MEGVDDDSAGSRFSILQMILIGLVAILAIAAAAFVITNLLALVGVQL